MVLERIHNCNMLAVLTMTHVFFHLLRVDVKWKTGKPLERSNLQNILILGLVALDAVRVLLQQDMLIIGLEPDGGDSLGRSSNQMDNCSALLFTFYSQNTHCFDARTAGNTFQKQKNPPKDIDTLLQNMFDTYLLDDKEETLGTNMESKIQIVDVFAYCSATGKALQQ